MSALISRKAAAAAAGGILAVITALANPAYADGSSSPFKGRTEGGSLIVKSGDEIASATGETCEVIDTNGAIHPGNKPGINFTSPAGAEFETLSTRQAFEGRPFINIEVTFKGASAVVQCGEQGFPTTTAFVPKSTLTGTGGSVTGVNTASTIVGGMLVVAGIAGGAVVLRRRRLGSTA